MATQRSMNDETQEESFMTNDVEQDVDESLWTSPVKSELPSRGMPPNAGRGSAQQASKSNVPSKEVREESLRQELASVRRVNEAIEGVLQSLEKAKSNMKNVNQTVGAASSLLNIWTRILSQTEHNQRLILDPTWQGASQDITDMEDEAVAKQQAAERKEAEEQDRRAAAARKAEEDERKRVEAATASSLRPKSNVRGRTGTGRGSVSSRGAYGTSVASAASANTSASSISRSSSNARRGSSGIGRVPRGSRSRG